MTRAYQLAAMLLACALLILPVQAELTNEEAVLASVGSTAVVAGAVAGVAMTSAPTLAFVTAEGVAYTGAEMAAAFAAEGMIIPEGVYTFVAGSSCIPVVGEVVLVAAVATAMGVGTYYAYTQQPVDMNPPGSFSAGIM